MPVQDRASLPLALGSQGATYIITYVLPSFFATIIVASIACPLPSSIFLFISVEGELVFWFYIKDQLQEGNIICVSCKKTNSRYLMIDILVNVLNYSFRF